MPTPTRNLLNEFKEAVKEIEKQVVKADNQPNLANQANSGNIDSLTKQISYLQNALKGDGFVTYPNSAKQIYPHNAIFEVPNEIRQIADIGDRVSASLEWLISNHPEMFKTQRAVKEVIDYVLKEPENIVSPKKGDGVILSKQNDKKMDEIGINQNSEVFHANKRKLNSNEKQAVSGDALPPHLDADNISLTGRYSVGGKPHLTAVGGNIIPQNAKNEVKEQAKIIQINEQRAKAKSEPTATKAKEPKAKPQATTAKERAAQTTATQKQAIKPQDPTDDRKYFKNLDSEEYKKISNPYLSRTIKNGDIKTLIDNGFDDYNQKVKKEILDFIKLDKDLYEYYQYQEKYREVDYASETFRMRHYDISSLSTRANIWAQDFSDKYLMAKYKLTKDELAKVRAKWNDSLVKNVISIHPIKEFGTNYAEFYHDGANAIKKLLTEKQGQVAGAFHKDGLGDIDLVWGNEKMGLAHILARRSEQWGEEKAIRFINHLAENIEKGTINAGKNGRAQINTELTTIVIDKNKDNRFILTAYRDKNNKKMSLENAKLVQSSTITDKGIETNAKDSSVLSSNQQPNSTTTANKSQELNLSRAERRAMGIEEPKGKTLVIDEKAVKSDVREFGRLADQVGLGFKSAKEAKAVMDKCDKSKFDCGS